MKNQYEFKKVEEKIASKLEESDITRDISNKPYISGFWFDSKKRTVEYNNENKKVLEKIKEVLSETSGDFLFCYKEKGENRIEAYGEKAKNTLKIVNYSKEYIENFTIKEVYHAFDSKLTLTLVPQYGFVIIKSEDEVLFETDNEIELRNFINEITKEKETLDKFSKPNVKLVVDFCYGLSAKDRLNYYVSGDSDFSVSKDEANEVILRKIVDDYLVLKEREQEIIAFLNENLFGSIKQNVKYDEEYSVHLFRIQNKKYGFRFRKFFEKGYKFTLYDENGYEKKVLVKPVEEIVSGVKELIQKEYQTNRLRNLYK